MDVSVVKDSARERIAADLASVAEFHDNGLAGWTREIFTKPYKVSRRWVFDTMTKAGLETSVDSAGNIIGRLRGQHEALPAIVTGSHTDTVEQGGRFDGMVGVLSGIEFARAVQESGTRLNRDLVIVDFLGEEANEFGISCLGSRAIAGVLDASHLDQSDGRRSLGRAFEEFGLDPSAAISASWKPGSIHAYIELHIEQGPLLEQSGDEIGVVTAIAGIDRILATFTGAAGHAGTMPMSDRADALVAAANAVLVVDRVGCGAPVHGVTTNGRIESTPGAMNVITDKARLWSEIRSVDKSWLDGARRQIVDEITAEARARGVDVDVDELTDQEPVPAARAMQDIIGATAGDLGYRWRAVPSGAGHDAAHMAHLGPMGMIFVPSKGGLSHCPEEFTDIEDIVRGLDVLANTILRLDGLDSVGVL